MKSYIKYLTVVVFAILLATGISYYFMIVNPLKKIDVVDKVSNSSNTNSIAQEKLFSGLSGKIIMDLVDKSNNIKGQWTYILDFDKDKPAFRRAPDYIRYDAIGFNFRVPGDVVFSGQKNLEDKTMQIYHVDLKRKPIKQEMITDDEMLYKHLPVLADDKDRILYYASNNKLNSAVRAEDMGIFMTTISGKKSEKVVSGSSPIWVSDNRFLYLANGGLAVYDLKNNKKFALWATSGGSALTNMHVSVSDDMRFVAWTLPGAGKLVVFKIYSWGKGGKAPIISLYDSYDINAVWVEFSPDSKYIMVQSFDMKNVKNNPKPKLAFFALGNKLVKLDWEFDLDMFDHSRMFISDWYKNNQ